MRILRAAGVVPPLALGLAIFGVRDAAWELWDDFDADELPLSNDDPIGRLWHSPGWPSPQVAMARQLARLVLEAGGAPLRWTE